MDGEEVIDFKRLDKEKLTPCSTSKENCPAPMTCLRRRPERTSGKAIQLRTIGEPHNDCLFYVMTELIKDDKYTLRGKQRRHNKHAPERPKLEFRQAPDLGVKRHIRMGVDINE